MFETFKATLIGVAPLLLHNGRLADPTDPHTKAIKALTSTRKKTDETHLEVRKAEWFGSLYTDEQGRIAIPSDNVIALVVNGAKKHKLGQAAKAAVFETAASYPLKYDGPKDLDKLYETPGYSDYRGVRVKMARLMRCRPRFNAWSLAIEINVNTDLMDADEVGKVLESAGEAIGLGDFRPRFGRFEVKR